MILGHFFATNSATDCGTDNNYDQDCSDDEKRADFHSKNDSWGSVVVVDLADVCWGIMLGFDDGILVGRCWVDRVVVFETVGWCDFWGVVVLV
jgi:hypothetical protein